ncbi:hypothetical protein D3C72_2283850 [compost metagenome]
MGRFQVLEAGHRPRLDRAFRHHQHGLVVADQVDFDIPGTVAGHGIEIVGFVGVEFQVGLAVAGSCARRGKASLQCKNPCRSLS